MYENELYHYGVKGMKWGVRRYRKFDGSYTRAGVKRFDNSLDKYEKANARYKDAKSSYKSFKKSNYSDSVKTELTNARIAKKNAKRQLDKDYKHLKQDKLGDKGKELYSKGKTITGNNRTTGMLSKIGGISISAAVYNYETNNITKVVNSVLGNIEDKKINQVLGIAGVGAIAIAGTKSAIDYSQNNKLRAYYSHTSNY